MELENVIEILEGLGFDVEDGNTYKVFSGAELMFDGNEEELLEQATSLICL